MKHFLAYIAGEEQTDGLASKLEDAVRIARKNPRWRKEYMDFRDYLDDAREEGRAEGLEEGRAEGRAEMQEQLDAAKRRTLSIEEENRRLKELLIKHGIEE